MRFGVHVGFDEDVETRRRKKNVDVFRRYETGYVNEKLLAVAQVADVNLAE